MFTQTGAMKLAFGLLRCRLSYAMIVQTECNEACFKLLRCRLSYAMIGQTECNEVCFKLLRCRLSYAKINIIFNISNRFGTKIDTKLLLCSKFAAAFA